MDAIKKYEEQTSAPGLYGAGARACSRYFVEVSCHIVRSTAPVLFLLVTVLLQSFLSFVGSHLVAFSFLSAGHFSKKLRIG